MVCNLTCKVIFWRGFLYDVRIIFVLVISCSEGEIISTYFGNGMNVKLMPMIVRHFMNSLHSIFRVQIVVPSTLGHCTGPYKIKIICFQDRTVKKCGLVQYTTTAPSIVGPRPDVHEISRKNTRSWIRAVLSIILREENAAVRIRIYDAISQKSINKSLCFTNYIEMYLKCKF